MRQASIIIPTHNRASFLSDTINSLRAQESRKFNVEILIIDNASTDETHEVVLQAKRNTPFPLDYIHEENIGLHHSRHAGAKKARGKILVFIDDDVIPSPGWLEAHINAHKDSSTWAVGGRVLPHWEADPPTWVHSMPKDYLSLLDYGLVTRPIRKNEGINGCNYSIKKNRLFEVGGFHPDSFSDPGKVWYRGDGEAGLTKKILRAGGMVLYEPNAMLRHRIPKERFYQEYFITRAYKHGIENGYSLMRKWNGSFLGIGYLLIIGNILRGWHSVLCRLSIGHQSRNLIHRLASTRFQAIAQYGWRVLNDPELRSFILRETYLD